ncbi:hypothetical protein [Geotalea toluenoxydans]|uniref:hypothetical protein n=1 Tax=Geotalea toluenoxydans TaxID=421624 RepID=UPI0006D0A5A9|nr:hypothetical protein [Geotalea toluenoxydans]
MLRPVHDWPGNSSGALTGRTARHRLDLPPVAAKIKVRALLQPFFRQKEVFMFFAGIGLALIIAFILTLILAEDSSNLPMPT